MFPFSTKPKHSSPDLSVALEAPKKVAAALPEQLLWLLDAPLLIDEPQVEALYDAILRPDYEETTATLSNSM